MTQYFKNIYEAVTTIIIGMAVTFRHLFTPAVTVQYPHERDILPERSRQKLYVDMDECEGCRQCERACPVNCIQVETVKALPEEDLGMTKEGKKKRLHVIRFDIDMSKCCYCNLCTFPCPTEAIYMTPDYEYATYDRVNFLIHFARYTAEEADRLRERSRKEKEAKLAALKKPGTEI
jgi:formate hydrogenlyase subunit 6/NADH:ubiquinone oxidoreductase subunit I